MKYGIQLERESVPEWSLHNLDYNSLKHEIKVHTTRDQATAIAIPGHQDTALRKFEDALYHELCLQHDRLDLFIVSKADEVLRRLDHVALGLQRFTAKSGEEHDSPSACLKRQRKFIKLERESLRCGEDIQALSRFSNAQIIAFRKILKKYRKWTGSNALSARFNEDVLSNPKSFTRRNFNNLQDRHDEVAEQLRLATPTFSEPSSPSTIDTPMPQPNRSVDSHQVTFDHLPPASLEPQIKYWNEYDNGSEGGYDEDEYAIYIDPNQESSFPGMAFVSASVERAKEWFHGRQSEHQSRDTNQDPSVSGPRHYSAPFAWFRKQQSERQPLISSRPSTSQTDQGYGSTSVTHLDSDDEGGYASSDGFPSQGYATHYALPSVSTQRVRRYRERVMFWSTLGCFAAAFFFLGIAGVLLATGKHKLRVEVDAGVTVGAVVSLFCACSGLGMTLYREDRLSISYRLMVWGTFLATCILDGMLLILVLGNAP